MHKTSQTLADSDHLVSDLVDSITEKVLRSISQRFPSSSGTANASQSVGIGHSFFLKATGWKWKLSTCFGNDGFSRIRNKTSVGLCDGVDFRFGWKADYVLPEITGALGTGEPLFNMESGRLQASLDRVEAIFSHRDD
ncbi:hypothetical protein KSS87_003138 [Heliosperma pusillum]|nr:hypothetical protein KSS87_003138 [Heliosperma pusillum]